jgi:hypothetical protein
VSGASERGNELLGSINCEGRLRWSRGSVLAFNTQVRGSNAAEAVGFLGRKDPQHAFLWRGSKAVDPMS